MSAWAFVGGISPISTTNLFHCIVSQQRLNRNNCHFLPAKQRLFRRHHATIFVSATSKRRLRKLWYAAAEGIGNGITTGNGVLTAAIDDTSDVEGRPRWAPRWLPQSVIKLRRYPRVQLVVMLVLYALHMFVLSTHGWKFGKPLMKDSRRLMKGVGYDAVVGAVVGLVALGWRRWMKKGSVTLEEAKVAEVGQYVGGNNDDGCPWKVPRERRKDIPKTVVILVIGFLLSGYFSFIIEQVMFLMAGYGVPLTVATTRAWKVLLGHLAWVYMGIKTLRGLSPFFPDKGTWLKWKWKSNWLWWAIGGYYISSFFFTLADAGNRLVLPSSMLDKETVVTKLINPEDRDVWAMIIGFIAPCMSAPIFEEVLYRGFLLPALSCFFPMWTALPLSSFLFAIHHMNATAIMPLTVLGFIWALLYKKSGNLLVTVLIHAMWNTRVFLGSFLSLESFTEFD